MDGGNRRVALRLVRRELVALSVASLVAWLVLAVRDVAVPWVVLGKFGAGAQWFWAYAGFGLPISLALSLLLGLMGFQFLESRNLRLWWHATLLGAVIGTAFTVTAFAIGVYPRLLSALSWLAPFDIAAGAAAGTVAWIFAKSGDARAEM